MKIYALLGHPDADTFNGKIFNAYCDAAEKIGHTVRRQRLGDMDFDPILHHGYKEIQGLEPDLTIAQENILWCDHWLMVYPMWWGNVPALLKGFLDRTLLPGFAFKYHKKGPFWDKLLKGRSAQIICTSDAPAFWIWWQYQNSDKNALKKATLEFCGFSPVKMKRFDGMKFKDDVKRAEILKTVENLASKLKP